MSQNVWLLVEWVDERNVIPSYGIVNVGSLIGMMTQLVVGKLISVRDNRLNANRRARILNISDNKHYLREQKKNLERDERDVQNVLSLCMRKMRGLNPETMYSGLMSSDPRASSSGASPLPVVIAGNESTSSSETDTEPNFNRHGIGRRYRNPAVANNAIFNNTHFNNNFNNIHYENAQFNNNHFNENNFNQDAPLNGHSSISRPFSHHQTPFQRSRSILCSTPIPSVNGNTQRATLTFDQATQTDDTLEKLKIQKIEQMESLLKALYIRFIKLEKEEKNKNTAHSPSSGRSEEIEQNGAEPTKFDQNKIESSPEQNRSESPTEQNGETGALLDSNVNGKLPLNGEFNSDAKMLQVRRMSAQPSFANDNEMIPIGAGNALVPRRVLKDINWSSYSVATRQLLQAVFPRRILATHSLTGKPSPAFMNKPPKGRLDPILVNDIVDTVSERCGVLKSLVRSSITIKCTDESKLYRNRQQLNQTRAEGHNQEIVPPSQILPAQNPAAQSTSAQTPQDTSSDSSTVTE